MRKKCESRWQCRTRSGSRWRRRPCRVALRSCSAASRPSPTALRSLSAVTRIDDGCSGEEGSAGKGQGDVTRGSIYLRLQDLEKRGYTQFEVMERARKILTEYPDLRCAVSDVQAIGAKGQDSRIFQLNLLGPDLVKLEEYSSTLKDKLRQIPGLVDVDSTLSFRKPEFQVSIDRERASDLGIPVQTIANTLSVLVGGQAVSRYKEGTEQYDVWLRADKQFRATSHESAILEANHTRLRPILMTTVMLIAAMIPIALGQGPGAGARASMAKVIIDGQMLSLLLALLVPPVTYSLFDTSVSTFRGEVQDLIPQYTPMAYGPQDRQAG